MFCSTQDGNFSSSTVKVHFEVLVYLLRYIREHKSLGLIYYSNIENAHISDILRQTYVNTENQLVVIYDSICQYCPDIGRSTESYILFCHGIPIDNYTHVTVPVSQPSAKS